MTIKIMGDTAALGTRVPADEKEQAPALSVTPEKPAVYVPEAETDTYIPTVRHSAGRSRKAGFCGVVFAQLVMTAAVGIALWAASAFGFGQASEICEELVRLFR